MMHVAAKRSLLTSNAARALLGHVGLLLLPHLLLLVHHIGVVTITLPQTHCTLSASASFNLGTLHQLDLKAKDRSDKATVKRCRDTCGSGKDS